MRLICFPFLNVPLILILTSECFVYTEYECCFSPAYTEVDPYICPALEFPPVAYADIRQDVAEAHGRKSREYGSRTGPHRKTVAPVDMLTKLECDIHLSLIAETPFVVSTHSAAAAKRGELAPGHISVTQSGMIGSGQNTPLPHSAVKPQTQFGVAEILRNISGKRWEIALLQRAIKARSSRREIIAGIILQTEAYARIGAIERLAIPPI